MQPKKATKLSLITGGKSEGTHRDEKRAKSTEPVVASDHNNALRDRKNCCVVEKERTTALLKAAAVEKNHGGQRARTGGGRSKHVEVQAILGLNKGDIRVVMVLQAARAISAMEFQVVNLKLQFAFTECRPSVAYMLPSRASVQGWGSTGEAKRRGPTGGAA
jgi:hypothetical protein